MHRAAVRGWRLATLALTLAASLPVAAQVPPSAEQAARYGGLLAAAMVTAS